MLKILALCGIAQNARILRKAVSDIQLYQTEQEFGGKMPLMLKAA
jgi:hypothetical protein